HKLVPRTAAKPSKPRCDISTWQYCYWNLLSKESVSRNTERGEEDVPCPKQNKLQSESVAAKPYRYWAPPDCHCRWPAPLLPCLEDRQQTSPIQEMGTAIESPFMRKKSQTLAWRRSMSSTKKATEHPQWYSLSAMVVAAVTVVEDAMAVEVGATAVVAAHMAAVATVVEDALTGAEGGVALASFLCAAVAAVVAVAVPEAIGAGLMAYAPGAPILIMAISAADLGAVLLGAQKNMVRLVAKTTWPYDAGSANDAGSDMHQ